MALLKGMMKVFLERDAQQPGRVLDRDFTHDHTQGFTACVRNLEHTGWARIGSENGEPCSLHTGNNEIITLLNF